MAPGASIASPWGHARVACGPLNPALPGVLPAREGFHVRSTNILAALLLSGLASPSAARAYEDQLHLGVAAGWGIAPEQPGPDNGPNLTLSGELGLDPAWGIGVVAGYAVHPPFNGGDAQHLLLLGAELTYVFDILEIVPRFGVGVDVLPHHDGTTWDADVAVHALVALDYLLTRTWLVGLDVRPYLRLTDLNGDLLYVSLQVRLGALFSL